MRVNEIEEAFLQYLPGTSEPVEECLPPEFSHLGVVGKEAELEDGVGVGVAKRRDGCFGLLRLHLILPLHLLPCCFSKEGTLSRSTTRKASYHAES